MIEYMGYELSWFLLLLIVWEVIWKAIGMWKSARNNHIWWFVAILVVNSLGILPIIYIALFNDKRNKNVKISKKRR